MQLGGFPTFTSLVNINEGPYHIWEQSGDGSYPIVYITQECRALSNYRRAWSIHGLIHPVSSTLMLFLGYLKGVVNPIFCWCQCW